MKKNNIIQYQYHITKSEEFGKIL